MCKSHPGSIGFQDTKGSLRAVEAWHFENTEGTIGEGVLFVAFEGLGLKGSC